MKKFEYNRPVVLSIAGFDPSGGAGLLADIKTFEQFKCLGMGVISANTVQVEDKFISVKWKSCDEIKEQLLPILESYSVKAVKIGIIQSIAVFIEVIDFIHHVDSSIQIVWDPVMASSSGFDLLNKPSKQELKYIMQRISLITPNSYESEVLLGVVGNEFNVKAEICAILLKGGHNTKDQGTDYLFLEDAEHAFNASPGDYSPKHGSGCILSSAITAGLASGLSIEDACRNGKLYIESCLTSNKNLLAYHVA